MVDFALLKDTISIEAVALWLDIETYKEGDKRRGLCPWCEHPDDNRAFVLTPARNLFYCFCARHRFGGSALDLAAKKLGVSLKTAADEMASHFHSPIQKGKTVPTPDDVLQELQHLVFEHELLAKIGLTKEDAERIGIGVATRGIMKSRVCIPIRDRTGRLVAYVGYSPLLEPVLKLPKQFRWGPAH